MRIKPLPSHLKIRQRNVHSNVERLQTHLNELYKNFDKTMESAIHKKVKDLETIYNIGLDRFIGEKVELTDKYHTRTHVVVKDIQLLILPTGRRKDLPTFEFKVVITDDEGNTHNNIMITDIPSLNYY